jgi:protein CpxP
MNKLITTIMTSLLLTIAGLTLSLDAYGEPGRKGQHQQRERGMNAMPVIDKVMHAIRRLDLDEAQRDSIRVIMQDLKAGVHPLMQETKAGHLELKELIKADTYDEDAVAALAEQEGALASERLVITSKALSDIFSQLTDEQRDQLETMAEERHERRGERHKKHPAED